MRIQAGQRVRLTAPAYGPARITGEIAGLGVKGMVVKVLTNSDTLLSVPYSSIEKMEVSLGRRGHAAAGAALGFGATLFAEFLIGKASSDKAGLGTLSKGNGMIVLGGVTAVGGLIGSFIKTDEWRQVSTPTIQVGMRLWEERAGLVVSLSFD
ncbi:MAG: hypothetical protein AB1644_09500 [Candidatus Zixiibacteriota bacterium]